MTHSEPSAAARIMAEDPIGLPDAAKLLPILMGGRSVSRVCLWRWALHGLALKSGQRVRLRAARVGRAWATSRQALLEFVEALTNDRLPSTDQKSKEVPRTPSQRRKASDAASAALEAAGM